MTLPGYQDWERVTRTNGDELVLFNQAFTASVFSPIINVQAWNSVMTHLFVPGGGDHYQINFSWLQDPLGANQLGGDFVVIGPNMLLPISVPVQGPYLQIEVVPKVGGNNTVCIFSFFAGGENVGAFQQNTYSGPILADDSAYAANGTINFQPTSIAYTRAKLVVVPDTAQIFAVTLFYWDWNTGAFVRYFRNSTASPANPLYEEVPLLATPLQVQVANGATAQSILTSISPMP